MRKGSKHHKIRHAFCSFYYQFNNLTPSTVKPLFMIGSRIEITIEIIIAWDEQSQCVSLPLHSGNRIVVSCVSEPLCHAIVVLVI